MDRSLPMIYRRAATAVAQCRGHVAKAQRDLSLAIEILGRLKDQEEGWPIAPSERERALDDLRDVLARLAGTEEALIRASAARREEEPATPRA
jgi:hypothetical protein